MSSESSSRVLGHLEFAGDQLECQYRVLESRPVKLTLGFKNLKWISAYLRHGSRDLCRLSRVLHKLMAPGDAANSPSLPFRYG